MAMVDIDDLSDAIMKELQEYSDEVTERVKEDVRQVAKVCVKDIKNRAPRLSGAYTKGWKIKTAYESASDIRVIIYNSKEYRLTHLLEYGHAKVSGGRVEAIPHIRPAEQEAEKRLMKKVKVTISGSDA